MHLTAEVPTAKKYQITFERKSNLDYAPQILGGHFEFCSVFSYLFRNKREI